MNSIGIIDYGASNLGNIVKTLKNFDIKIRIINKSKDIKHIDKLILPGIGSFKLAIDNLKEKGLDEEIIKFAEKGKMILGICLGMQLLFTNSNETGLQQSLSKTIYKKKKIQGLNLISGKVLSLKDIDKKIIVPNIGWRKIYNDNKKIYNKYFNKLGNMNNKKYYFSHSFFSQCGESIESQYIMLGNKKVVASVVKDNICGLQFHPEISGIEGHRILKNFSRI
jgi:glutamine amidotransferase